ncbi:hypothetical protein [Bacillus timonensis]|uniref:hypothetical protein n=1 Tax=Bacillus timonensis TaxID=1033734 RepID=UPI000288B520|nr:hypothetical protein [Bacillus timonensis]
MFKALIFEIELLLDVVCVEEYLDDEIQYADITVTFFANIDGNRMQFNGRSIPFQMRITLDTSTDNVIIDDLSDESKVILEMEENEWVMDYLHNLEPYSDEYYVIPAITLDEKQVFSELKFAIGKEIEPILNKSEYNGFRFMFLEI